jgi:hypothetical protein
VTASGQLGVLASSERYKTDVQPMPDESGRLAQLKPVTFKLKADESGTVQYGLIAEDVVKVYPELVVRGEDGQINGVRYEELAPMLLGEVQRLKARIGSEDKRAQRQDTRIVELEALIAAQAGAIRRMQEQLAGVEDLRRQVAAMQQRIVAGQVVSAHLDGGQ